MRQVNLRNVFFCFYFVHTENIGDIAIQCHIYAGLLAKEAIYSDY
jgi:hypothetical protein